MNAITATELQLLACFGVEPRLLDAGVPWCYNCATYEVEIDGLAVLFAIEPTYRDVRIVVRSGAKQLFQFDSKDVADVRVIDKPGVDAIEVVMAEMSGMVLQLRPTFEIVQNFTSNDAREGRKGRRS